MEATLQSCEHGQRDPRDEMFGPRRQFHMDGLRTGIRERVAINGSADSNDLRNAGHTVGIEHEQHVVTRRSNAAAGRSDGRHRGSAVRTHLRDCRPDLHRPLVHVHRMGHGSKRDENRLGWSWTCHGQREGAAIFHRRWSGRDDRTGLRQVVRRIELQRRLLERLQRDLVPSTTDEDPPVRQQQRDVVVATDDSG